jgi:hypothetical protein
MVYVINTVLGRTIAFLFDWWWYRDCRKACRTSRNF